MAKVAGTGGGASRKGAPVPPPGGQRVGPRKFVRESWGELRKVQWPDRDTLIQASAVTLLFVAVAATYLGVLDAIFGWLVDRLIT